MLIKKLFSVIFTFSCLTFMGCGGSDKPVKGPEPVQTIGSVKKTMWQGILSGVIDLDTFKSKEHLYGLGPLENLVGEIVISDGKAYKATLLNDSIINVEETFKIKAPFFVYAHVNKWMEQVLPDSIQSVQQIDDYLGSITQNNKKSFAFKITATIDSSTIYIINVPEGMAIHSPGDADQAHEYLPLNGQAAEIIGFYSNKGSSIFAQGETHLHMHVITDDKKKMGHLEAVTFKKGSAKLYLPEL